MGGATVVLDPSEGRHPDPGVLQVRRAELEQWLQPKERQLEHLVEYCSTENIDRLGLEPRQGLVWQVLTATPVHVNTSLSGSSSSSSSSRHLQHTNHA